MWCSGQWDNFSLSWWQTNRKEKISVLVQPVSKTTPDSNGNNINSINLRRKKCTFKIVDTTASFDEDWSTTRDLVTFLCAGWSAWPSVDASALFSCLFLQLDANMRKNDGISFSYSCSDGLIRRFSWPCSCLGMEAVSNHFPCALVWGGGWRTSWTRSKPELIRDADKNDACVASCIDKLHGKKKTKSCIFSPQTAADFKGKSEFAWRGDDGRKWWWRELRRNCDACWANNEIRSY